MRKDLGEEGLIKTLLGLFLLIALIAAAVSFIRPYYSYHTLGSHTRDYLMTEVGDVNAIRKHILADAAELGIPLEEKDLSVEIKQKIVRVKASWTDTVDLWGYYRKDIDFTMEEAL